MLMPAGAPLAPKKQKQDCRGHDRQQQEGQIILMGCWASHKRAFHAPSAPARASGICGNWGEFGQMRGAKYRKKLNAKKTGQKLGKQRFDAGITRAPGHCSFDFVSACPHTKQI